MKLLALIIVSLSIHFVSAQKFTTEKSLIIFYSDASIEDIKAENDQSISLFDTSTGQIAFSIPIKEFQFEKSLMKEHFNEKYLESEKFPKSTFQGRVEGYQSTLKGRQPVKAIGKLTIHGVMRDVEISGTLEWRDNKIVANSSFKVRLEDYKIKVPQLLWQNIAEEVEVTIDFTYKPL
jgi:polyisoprenoid-binding protein YceI